MYSYSVTSVEDGCGVEDMVGRDIIGKDLIGRDMVGKSMVKKGILGRDFIENHIESIPVWGPKWNFK